MDEVDVTLGVAYAELHSMPVPEQKPITLPQQPRGLNIHIKTTHNTKE